jgi:hypothetical protein
MIAKDDKSNTTVIIYTQAYMEKLHSFLAENNFQPIPTNPTAKDHKTIHKTLQRCDRIIDKKHANYLTQKHPTTPTLIVLLKLHKPNIPIRQVVNNINAPHHKAAKKLTRFLPAAYI